MTTPSVPPVQPTQLALPPRRAAGLLPLSVWIAPVLAFAAFGALLGGRTNGQLVAIVALVIIGVLFAFLGAHLLVLVLRAAHPKLESTSVQQATAIGLLLVAPFAVLALAAELLLGWNASQVFSSAGLMTACGAVGAEVGRRGGTGLRSVLVPTVIAFGLSTTWVILAVMARGLWS